MIVTGLVVLALASIQSNQHNNTRALCSFKNDLQRRVDQGNALLKTHPEGIAGIPAATIQASIQNQQASLISLDSLMC